MFFGQEVHYYMVYIAYFTELKLQICYYAQKRRICREIVNTRLTKIFMAIFAPDERLPSSATLLSGNICPCELVFWLCSPRNIKRERLLLLDLGNNGVRQ